MKTRAYHSFPSTTRRTMAGSGGVDVDFVMTYGGREQRRLLEKHLRKEGRRPDGSFTNEAKHQQ